MQISSLETIHQTVWHNGVVILIYNLLYKISYYTALDEKKSLQNA